MFPGGAPTGCAMRYPPERTDVDVDSTVPSRRRAGTGHDSGRMTDGPLGTDGGTAARALVPPVRMLARGLVRRCPLCGQGRLFRLWFSLAERCPCCHLRFERIEGHWLGALGLNTIVSFTVLFVVVVAGLVLSHPDYRMAPLIAAAAGTAVVVPLVFFPSSKTLWTAIDLCMRPLEPGEARQHPGLVERRER